MRRRILQEPTPQASKMPERLVRRFIGWIMAVGVAVASCSNATNETPKTISTGKKIFLTPELHSADFAHDPTLSGGTGVARADDFCSKSIGRPDNATYKALIVDGTNRDAQAPIDWVLLPSTKYFQIYNDVEIDVTTAAAIFNAAFTPMQNPICTPGFSCPSSGATDAWTGIGNASTFAADTRDCANWSDGSNSMGGIGGLADQNSGAAFSGVFISGCSLQVRLYCVEQ